MSLGERIRSLRTERNMSQNDLAESLKVSRQSISKWETDGATPDLDKLVSMSEIFGITLDELIKGAAPIPDMQASGAETSNPAPNAKEVPIRAPHRIAGIILLCFGALMAILFFLLGGGLASLMFASPFLLCGIICLYTHKRAGLWCGWAVYLCVDLYLRYAIGITWRIIWMTAQFTPEMNYTRLATGWGQFLVGVLLIVLTLWSYRKKTAACDKKHIIVAGTDLLLLVGLTFAQNEIIRYFHSLPYERVNDIWYFWLRSCGDYIRLCLLVALLVQGCALIRQRRVDKRA